LKQCLSNCKYYDARIFKENGGELTDKYKLNDKPLCVSCIRYGFASMMEDLYIENN